MDHIHAYRFLDLFLGLSQYIEQTSSCNTCVWTSSACRLAGHIGAYTRRCLHNRMQTNNAPRAFSPAAFTFGKAANCRPSLSVSWLRGLFLRVRVVVIPSGSSRVLSFVSICFLCSPRPSPAGKKRVYVSSTPFEIHAEAVQVVEPRFDAQLGSKKLNTNCCPSLFRTYFAFHLRFSL
jgi:hypothetical protein